MLIFTQFQFKNKDRTAIRTNSEMIAQIGVSGRDWTGLPGLWELGVPGCVNWLDYGTWGYGLPELESRAALRGKQTLFQTQLKLIYKLPHPSASVSPSVEGNNNSASQKYLRKWVSKSLCPTGQPQAFSQMA